MKSFSISRAFALFAFTSVLVEASPFLNALPPRMRQDAFVQARKAKGTGASTQATSAVGTGAGKATSTAATAKAVATSALNATVLSCEIIVRTFPL
jgi:hypothetical protein